MKKNPLNLNPHEEFRQMLVMVDRRFGPPGELPVGPSQEAIPVPLDATERDGIVTIKAAVPGIDRSQMEVFVGRRGLTVRSLPECPAGHFCRTVPLPSDLAIGLARTGVRNGFVVVKIPKSASRHAAA